MEKSNILADFGNISRYLILLFSIRSNTDACPGSISVLLGLSISENVFLLPSQKTCRPSYQVHLKVGNVTAIKVMLSSVHKLEFY